MEVNVEKCIVANCQLTFQCALKCPYYNIIFHYPTSYSKQKIEPSIVNSNRCYDCTICIDFCGNDAIEVKTRNRE